MAHKDGGRACTKTRRWSYRLEQDDYYGWVLLKLGMVNKWLYSFTEEQHAKDFIMATYWCENSPDSIFINDAMVAIRTSEGRNTISEKFVFYR